mgnify:CR=1 FL=1
MEFEWDDAKRDSNIRKHGVDFADAARILSREHFASTSSHTGEERIVAIGPLNPPGVRPKSWSGSLAVVVYTMRGDTYRIISARRANTNERKRYYSRFPRRS